MPLKLLGTLALAATASAAQASLILDTTVTAAFLPGATTTNTIGNDLPAPRPSTLYYGQLRADADGFVDFYYVGNEAGYTNTLFVDDALVASTAGRPDSFNSPHLLVATLAVSAGELIDFGFCTSGGDRVLGSRCVANDSAVSIISQYNHRFVGGYRSIGFAALSDYDPATGARTFTTPTGSRDNWMAFWDDSGARYDDNHDDMIVGLSFRPVDVSEPGTLGLAALGMMGAIFAARRSRTPAC
ncbi:MAG: PEP-CTERM sorting domain-containing protein [Gammaproteobacteria bacterium]|nr:PEP-CTERM sorting domain-containing protein [Gammaproteobacteria bacterium]